MDYKTMAFIGIVVTQFILYTVDFYTWYEYIYERESDPDCKYDMDDPDCEEGCTCKAWSVDVPHTRWGRVIASAVITGLIVWIVW